jgi:hypothetical protein
MQSTRFPEMLQFKGPSGLKAAVAAVAARDHTSASEIIRQGTLAHLRRLGAPLDQAESSDQQRRKAGRGADR